MIKLISLHGIFSGSATVETCGKNLKLKLKLRGKACPDVKTVYLIGADGITRIPIKNGGGSAEAVDFRGLIAADGGGNFIAEGVCGMNPSELNKAKAAVRMMQSSQTARTASALNAPADGVFRKENPFGNERSAPGRAERIPEIPNAKLNPRFPAGRAQGQEKTKGAEARNSGQAQDGKQTNNKTEQENRRGASPAASAQSGSNQPRRNAAQITSEILDTAKRLFEIQNNMVQPPFQRPDARRRDTVPPAATNANKGNSNAEVSKKRSAPSYEAASANAEKPRGSLRENPFPRLFPNSSWKSVSGDESRLAGAAKVKGVTYDIIAIRSNNRRYPPKGLKGNIRRLLSKDGKLYWIGITLKS